MLELNVEEGDSPEEGVTVPDCDADKPAESVVVGVTVCELLTLTVVEEV